MLAREVPAALEGPPTVMHAVLEHQHGSVEIDASSSAPPVRRSVGDLLEMSERFAAGLAAAGVGPGDRVISLLPTSHEFVALFLACWRLRAAPVALPFTRNPRRRARAVERVARVAADCGATAVVAEEAFIDLPAALPEGVRFLVADALDRCRADANLARMAPEPEDLAFLQYTSGSTDQPKGVVVRHRNLLANLRAMAGALGVENVRRTVTWLPIHHDMGLIGGLLLPLRFAGHVGAVRPERFMADPLCWLRLLTRFRGRCSPVPTFALALTAERAPDGLHGLDLADWAVCPAGAEPVFPHVVERFHKRFQAFGLSETTVQPAYGLAEATLAVSFAATGTPRRTHWISQDALRRSGSVEPAAERAPGAVPLLGNGAPLEGIEVAVASPAGEALPEGREGRLLIRGGSVTEGYFGEPERRGPVDWLDTGDLGFLLDGDVFVTGRAKDLIIRAGANLHPHDLEAATRGLVDVGAAAAFSSVRHDRGREEIVLVAETRRRAPGDRDRLVREVSAAVAREAAVQVDRVVLVAPGSLPRTTSGKLQRHLLRQRYEAGELREPEVESA